MKKPLVAAVTASLLVAAPAIPALAASKSKTVKLADNKFVPKSVTVKQGTTVKFVWTGKAPHNVTVSKGPVKFRSSTKTKGSFSEKLTHKGTYTIFCTIHAPGMKLTLKVD